MKKILSKYFFPASLIVLSTVLCVVNYKAGTFLSGWDTLHPEFNFPEYFKRILFGVWQEHQGLGALSSQAHPSEFPRMLLYYPLSFILPLSFLRYSYFFITLILGPLGMYFFIKRAVFREDSLHNKIASFGGALFYLFNLGTIQHYFVPLEMFATHFATLPWLFLFIVQSLEYNYKRYLILFAIFTFFSASIAHTSTLWFAYLLSLILFLFAYNFLNRKKEIRITTLKIIAVTLLINSFWLLPNLHFIFNQGTQISSSKINSLFTEEAFANNRLFGTIPDILIFKNFLFNWSAYTGNGEFGPLLKVWIDHLQNPITLIIGYGLALIALLGLAYSTFKRNLVSLCLLTILGLSVFFLLTDNPPFGLLFNFLQKVVPLFREAIRFPFTKFSILLMFALSLYFAFGVKLLIKKFSMYSFILIFLAFLYYMLPAFQGNLISPLMKVNIPSSYFSAFDLLNNKPYGRVATLPIHSFWGWNYYSWGYQGAGFSWFGLKDPVLEREFDRWNPANEQYYREMSQAIYSQDQNRLNNVLQKYDISYILWDKSIIAPEQGTDRKVLFQNETENLLNSDSELEQIAHFGDLLVYETRFNNPQVRSIKNPVSIGPPAVFYDDTAYAKYRDYITYFSPEKNSVIYPFRDIINNQNKIISQDVMTPLSNSAALDTKPNLSAGNDCPPADSPEETNFQKSIVSEDSNSFLEYTSEGGSFCDHFSYPTLLKNQAYIISTDSRNVKGLPLRICVRNYISNRCDLFTHLSGSKEFTREIFLIPPTGQSVGFDINLNNFSVKNNPSVNHLKAIDIFPFEYDSLSQIENYPTTEAQDTKKDVLVYSQAFDPDWKTYEVNLKDQKSSLGNTLANIFPFLYGEELKEHVLVNNWANGWIMPSSKSKVESSKFVIIFWPQYLEYLGLFLLAATFLSITINRAIHLPNFLQKFNLSRPKSLVFLILLFIAGNLLWVKLNTFPPFYDSAGHTNTAFAYADIFTGQRQLSSIKEFLTVNTYYPPLFFIMGGLLTSVFGQDYKVLQFSSVFLLGISAFFLYLYVKELTQNKKWAILASAIFVTLPNIWEQSRYFMLDLPLTTLIIIILYLLQRFNNTTKNLYLLLSLLFIGLAQLTKWYAGVYLAIPALLTLYSYFKHSQNRKKPLILILIALGINLITALPWYIINFQQVLSSGLFFTNPDFGDPTNLFSPRNLLFYPTLLLNYQIVSLQFILLILGIIFFFRERKKKLIFGLQILLAYLVFTFIGNKNLRYTLPLLPFLAVIMGYGAIKLLAYGKKGKFLLAGFFIFSFAIFTINSFGLPIKTNFRLAIAINRINKNLDNLYLLDLSARDIPYLFIDTPMVEKEIVIDLSNQQIDGQTRILVNSNNPYISVAGLELFNKNNNLFFMEVPTDNSETIRDQKIENLLNQVDFILVPSQVVAPPGQSNYFNLDEIRKYILAGKTRNFALIKIYQLPNKNVLFLLKRDNAYNAIKLQITKDVLTVTRPQAIADIYLQFMDPDLNWHQEIIEKKDVVFEKKLTNTSRFRIDYPSNLMLSQANGWTYDGNKQFDRLEK
ncbi:MAG: glycosyltransferase family 39 protein [Candidatus Levybacteria bacterium]|nr:glycosyltransferase family 39 protein [Candidatus Levybacteria bacterium]